MTEEEKKEYEELKSLLYTGTISQYGKRKLIEIIEKQSKEIEELKDESKEYQIGFAQGCYEKDLDWKDKIKAKIEERMQKNNNIIHNAKLKYGKDYIYYDDVQEAKEENHICKEVLQSLLEKE